MGAALTDYEYRKQEFLRRWMRPDFIYQVTGAKRIPFRRAIASPEGNYPWIDKEVRWDILGYVLYMRREKGRFVEIRNRDYIARNQLAKIIGIYDTFHGKFVPVKAYLDRTYGKYWYPGYIDKDVERALHEMENS